MSRLETLASPGRPRATAEDQGYDEKEFTSPMPNVGDTERTISFLGGIAVAGLGLLRGGLSGVAMAGAGLLLAKRGYTGHCQLYEALGIDTSKDEGADPEALYERGLKIREAITIARPAGELYEHWRQFDTHPSSMPNVQSVSVENQNRTNWQIRGPGGSHWEYEAEVINDEPGRLIAWRSVDGAEVSHAGSVRFLDAPAGRGTEVHLNVEYLPPAGPLGRFGAKLLRSDR